MRMRQYPGSSTKSLGSGSGVATLWAWKRRRGGGRVIAGAGEEVDGEVDGAVDGEVAGALSSAAASTVDRAGAVVATLDGVGSCVAGGDAFPT
jgi:hypothetical protein